jgi:hypothetical protein
MGFQDWLAHIYDDYPQAREAVRYDNVEPESENESESTYDQSLLDWQSDSDDDFLLREDDSYQED